MGLFPSQISTKMRCFVILCFAFCQIKTGRVAIQCSLQSKQFSTKPYRWLRSRIQFFLDNFHDKNAYYNLGMRHIYISYDIGKISILCSQTIATITSFQNMYNNKYFVHPTQKFYGPDPFRNNSRFCDYIQKPWKMSRSIYPVY